MHVSLIVLLRVLRSCASAVTWLLVLIWGACLMRTAHSAVAPPSSSNSNSSEQLRAFLQKLPASNSTACVDRELQWLKAETFNLTKPAEPCSDAEYTAEATDKMLEEGKRQRCDAEVRLATLKANITTGSVQSQNSTKPTIPTCPKAAPPTDPYAERVAREAKDRRMSNPETDLSGPSADPIDGVQAIEQANKRAEDYIQRQQAAKAAGASSLHVGVWKALSCAFAALAVLGFWC